MSNDDLRLPRAGATKTTGHLETIYTYQRRLWLTAMPAIAHLVIATLRHFDRAVYQGREYTPLGHFVDSQPWFLIHLCAALWIIATIVFDTKKTAALCLSGSILMVWSVLLFIWGVGLRPPVSLLGPSLGIVMSVVAYILAEVWSSREV